jgi:mannose-6-phosphate isomerase
MIKMTETLYPIKFKPQFKDKIWGGKKIKSVLGKDFSPLLNCGESWEISSVEDNLSVVENGFLQDNNIQEIIEVYMGDLVGDKVYEKYGVEFPLLIKFIDANADLSIQVHPDDELSKKRHNAYGKTEMWYVIDAGENAQLISGFKKEISRKEYLSHIENNTLLNILNSEPVSPGDVFFIPAGRVHAIGAGILLAEIQQTSDVTYRIFDYHRKDQHGNLRELHNDLAIDAIDFNIYPHYKTDYQKSKNEPVSIADCQYFKTNHLEFDKEIRRDYFLIDSFIVYICLNGNFKIIFNENSNIDVKIGETILIPASLKSIRLEPDPRAKILEVYIP